MAPGPRSPGPRGMCGDAHTFREGRGMGPLAFPERPAWHGVMPACQTARLLMVPHPPGPSDGGGGASCHPRWRGGGTVGDPPTGTLGQGFAGGGGGVGLPPRGPPATAGDTFVFALGRGDVFLRP